jgi:hypothetical protein
MDSRSVESAFSTIPVATGAFAWSASRETMPFTPGGGGPRANPGLGPDCPRSTNCGARRLPPLRLRVAI